MENEKIYQIRFRYTKYDDDEAIDSFEFLSAIDYNVSLNHGFEFLYEYGGAVYTDWNDAINARDELVRKLKEALEIPMDSDAGFITSDNEFVIKVFDYFEEVFIVDVVEEAI